MVWYYREFRSETVSLTVGSLFLFISVCVPSRNNDRADVLHAEDALRRKQLHKQVDAAVVYSAVYVKKNKP